MADPITDDDLAGWREPGGEYEAVYAIIARLDLAEAEVGEFREAATLALERFAVVDDEIRFDPAVWEALEPLRQVVGTPPADPR